MLQKCANIFVCWSGAYDKCEGVKVESLTRKSICKGLLLKTDAKMQSYPQSRRESQGRTSVIRLKWPVKKERHCTAPWTLHPPTRILSSRIVFNLSGEFSARQAQREVVKIKNLDFSYWVWSTPLFWIFSKKFFTFFIFYSFRNVITNQKKLKTISFLKKLKIMICLFHRNEKNPILEMALKSFIISKLDHQMSKIMTPKVQILNFTIFLPNKTVSVK